MYLKFWKAYFILDCQDHMKSRPWVHGCKILKKQHTKVKAAEQASAVRATMRPTLTTTGAGQPPPHLAITGEDVHTITGLGRADRDNLGHTNPEGEDACSVATVVQVCKRAISPTIGKGHIVGLKMTSNSSRDLSDIHSCNTDSLLAFRRRRTGAPANEAKKRPCPRAHRPGT